MYQGRSLVDIWNLVERAWREDLHPRASDGKFGSGGPSPKSSTAKTSTPAAGKSAGSKPAARKTAAGTSAGSSATPAAKKAPATKKTPAAKASSPAAKDKTWQDNHYAEWKQRLTPAQSRAISGYQGADYGAMNAQLRSQGKNGVKDDKYSDEEMAQAARANRQLIDAIRKAPPTTEPMTVHRTMTAAMAAGLKPGATVGDKGFVSASLSPKKTSKGATVEIDLPAGTKAAVGANGEMILPSSGRFHVVSVEDGPNGQPHVRMEFVPHGSKATPKADAAPKKSAAKTPAKAAPETPAEPKAADSKADTQPPEAPAAPEGQRRPGMRDATRHTTHSEGAEWLEEKMPNPKKKPFTAADRAAVKNYTGSNYTAINFALRNPDAERDPKTQSIIDGIDAAMAKSTVPEDVIVHRGVGADYVQRLGADLGNPASMRSLIGKVATEDSYLSTSTGGKAAFDDKPVRLMMRVPKGHHAINAMPISKYPDERELLLDRNTSLLVHDAYEVDGKWHVEVEAVPTGFQPGPDWKPDPAGDAQTGYAPGAEWGIPSAGSGDSAPVGSVDSLPDDGMTDADYADYAAYLDSGGYEEDL